MVGIEESILVFGTFRDVFVLMVGHKDRTLSSFWTDDDDVTVDRRLDLMLSPGQD